jgi:hypothetical protein
MAKKRPLVVRIEEARQKMETLNDEQKMQALKERAAARKRRKK